MRICFELLELLKAHKKAIRRATVNTFGYIAKAIGLLKAQNLKFCILCILPRKTNMHSEKVNDIKCIALQNMFFRA